MALPRSRLGRLFEGIRRYRRNGAAGDFALLKADALGGRDNPRMLARLERVAGPPPEIDLEQLRGLPQGSFGRAYAEALIGGGLTPLTVSPDLAAVVQRNRFALRYLVTHDMFHVMLGYDTSLAGEIGVLAFATAQGYGRRMTAALVLATLFYPLCAPHRVRRILAHLGQGWRRGREAVFLLGEPLEERFAEPLDALRREYRLLA